MDGLRVAVTGAHGFIGRALVSALAAEEVDVRPLVRSANAAGDLALGDIGPETDWSEALEDVGVVVHLAARAHVLRETADDPLAAFREVNLDGTRRLAQQAASAGVGRLVFLSSIGVLGVHTNGRGPFSATDAPAPVEHYGRSKWEAEDALWQIAAETRLEVVVIRPPLVYGPGVRANFARLMRLVQSGWPLPFGAVANRRSLVALDNLVDLLARCVDAPKAAGETFLVADGEDLSTPELVRGLAEAMGRPARLVPVPPALLRLGGRLTGRSAEVERLIGSLQVDITHTCETLDWRPPISVQEGLRRAVVPVMNAPG